MSQPKFLFNHILPFDHDEIKEIVECARIALAYEPSRMKIMNDTNIPDVHLSVLEKKIHEYQEKIR